MTQPSLFDIAEGRQQRDEALAQAAAHAEPDWIEDALRTVYQVAKTHSEFTGADIWQAGLRKPEEPRRLGVVMRMAGLKGWIDPTNRTRKSEIPSQHRQPLQVWKSLIFTGGNHG